MSAAENISMEYNGSRENNYIFNSILICTQSKQNKNVDTEVNMKIHRQHYGQQEVDDI